MTIGIIKIEWKWFNLIKNIFIISSSWCFKSANQFLKIQNTKCFPSVFPIYCIDIKEALFISRGYFFSRPFRINKYQNGIKNWQACLVTHTSTFSSEALTTCISQGGERRRNTSGRIGHRVLRLTDEQRTRYNDPRVLLHRHQWPF